MPLNAAAPFISLKKSNFKKTGKSSFFSIEKEAFPF